MARAKRTDRAEARRRYRSEVAEAAATETEAADDEDSDAKGQSTGTSAGQSAGTSAGQSASQRQPRPNQMAARGAAGSAPTTRPGFMGVLRSAARPWDLRSDIAYVPQLVLRSPAVLVPAAATVASGAFFLLSQPPGSNGIALFLATLFVIPPTIAGPFLAGMLAPRATYIAGGIAAFIGVVVFAFIVLTVPVDSLTLQPRPSPSPAASLAPSASATANESAAPPASAGVEATPSPDSTPGTGTTIDRTAVVIQSFLLSVPFGVVIGAAGGYYRRFLRLSGASGRRREAQRARQPRGPGRRR